MSILVVGSTGFVGGQVALMLQKQNGDVRALVRGGSENPKAELLKRAGAEVIDGDLTRPDSLERACRGVATVISSATSMPTGANDGLRTVDLEGTRNLISAAESAGVNKFVYLSASRNIDVDSPLMAAKRGCEDRLLATSMQIVILRPSYFMEVWLSPVLGFDPRRGTARIYGDGNAKVSYVSALDVSHFTVAATNRKYDRKHNVFEIGGPEALSQLEAVAIFEQALKSKMSIEHVPTEALEAQHHSTDPLQKSFAALMLSYAKGDVVEGAHDIAADHGINLRSVGDYASSLDRAASSVA